MGTTPPHDPLADYYWQMQQLRLQVRHPELQSQARRDLGLIYLRTGHFAEADILLSGAVVEERLDPRLWFYHGLSKELVGRDDEAIVAYRQALTLSEPSTYDDAMRGRIAWLEEKQTARALQAQFANTANLPADETLAENAFAVFPFACGSDAELGAGFSDVIARNLDQLRGITIVDPDVVRRTLAESAGHAPPSQQARTAWIGRLLGAEKTIEGACTIDSDAGIAVDAQVRDVVTGAEASVQARGRLDDFPELERQFVDQLIDQLRIWLPNRERRTPLSGLNADAMTAYSQGLLREDAGALEESLDLYRETVFLNPGFKAASTRIETVRHKLLARSDTSADLLALLHRLEAANAAPHLIESRLGQASQSIDAGFLPGTDARTQPPGRVGELPAPPPPTGNR